MDDVDWDSVRFELHHKMDSLLVHALAHYVHAGHPYRLEMRSPNALPWLDDGEYVMLVRIRDSESYWNIRAQLARERGIRDY